MRTILTLVLVELHRPRRRARHAHLDPLAGATVPPPVVSRTWYPVADGQRVQHEKRLEAAKQDREAAIAAWFRGAMSADGLRECERSYRETVRELQR